MLLQAVEGNILQAVENLIKEGHDINESDVEKNTPLHLASTKGHYQIAQILIKAGCDINVRNYKKSTPLHLASSSNNVEIVNLLIENKASVNAEDDNLYTPLHAACLQNNLQIIQHLIKVGANVNAQDLKQKTALHHALSNGASHYNILWFLLESGCNVNLCDVNKISPLFYACAFETPAIVELLLRHNANPFQVSTHGSYPMDWAIECNNFEAVELLLSYGADPNIMTIHPDSIPVIYATACRYKAIVQVLLAYNCDINKTNEELDTALHIACKVNDIEIVELLIKHGANMYKSNMYGDIPLHIACSSGHSDVVHLLASFNCNVNLLNDNAISPLMLAVQYGHPGVVKALIMNGCSFQDKLFGGTFKVVLEYIISKTMRVRPERPYLFDYRIPLLLISAGYNLNLDILILEDYFEFLIPHIITDNIDFFDMMIKLVRHPLSLIHLSCSKIRECIGLPLQKQVKLLELPSRITDILAFNYL